ncbi:MAG TPA: right-handed parallel beta-helix repeat-containing protein [Rhizomicrobium sp.]|nr:right-handed parallel beta-helix repeat-containing protein [Rhizomicrobium sp.]
MKKHLTIIGLGLTFASPTSAQNVNPPSVPNIEALEALSASGAKLSHVYVKDFGNGHGGGGTFTYSASECNNAGAGDGGTQFPAKAGCWHRQITNNEIDPTMFGAAGNGRSDDTPFLVKFFAALNAGTYSGDGESKTYVLDYSNTPYNFTRPYLTLRNITLQAKPGTSSKAWWIGLTADHTTLENVILDGNMANMTASTQGAAYCLLVDNTANYQSWSHVTVKNCNSQDAILFGASGAAPHHGSAGHKIDSLTITGNSASGMEFQNTSSSSFVNVHINANGYGYQVRAPFPIDRSTPRGTDVGFGVAIRFNSHDLQFVNSQFNDNGRDGFNVNQGSHNILVTNSEANFNGDGGFTFAADSTAAYPGNGQSPSNVRLSNDAARGNYTGGVTAYSAISGLSVIGGKYWDNSRVEGDLAPTSSYFNNIYIPAGSRDVYVKTSAYDDRQSASVTSSGSCTFTVNRWAPGTYRYYPKVGFYTTNGRFVGYGQIFAESSSRLTVTTLPFNSAKCSDISAGWMVTQRVTHNGALLDRGSTGQLDVVGSGFLPGPNPAIQGHVELTVK